MSFLSYFSYPFVRYAFICALLISLCAALLGVSLVLKRYSFMGDGLSHVSFGALAISSVLSVSNDLIIVMPITIICAILLLRLGENAKVKGDSALAIISVSSVSIGYLLLNLFSKSANISGDVCSSLFGTTSILTLSKTDVRMSLIFAILVILFFVFFYNKIFGITFDENFSKATGLNVNLYNSLIAIVTSIVIVISMKLVGALLTSALIIFPSLISMRLFNNFKKVTISSAIISVISSSLGIILSILFSTPIGATIVILDLLIYIVVILIKR